MSKQTNGSSSYLSHQLRLVNNIDRNQQKCKTQVDSDNRDQYNFQEYYGSVFQGQRKKSIPYYQMSKKFLDESNDSNNDSDITLPPIQNKKSSVPKLGESRELRVSQHKINPIIYENKSAHILKDDYYSQDKGISLIHQKSELLQNSIDKASLKEYYDEPEQINTQKLQKRRVVSFNGINSNHPKQRREIQSIQQQIFQNKPSVLSYQNNTSYHNQNIDNQNYQNKNLLLQQNSNNIKINELKDRQIERTQKNIQELQIKGNQIGRKQSDLIEIEESPSTSPKKNYQKIVERKQYNSSEKIILSQDEISPIKNAFSPIKDQINLIKDEINSFKNEINSFKDEVNTLKEREYKKYNNINQLVTNSKSKLRDQQFIPSSSIQQDNTNSQNYPIIEIGINLGNDKIKKSYNLNEQKQHLLSESNQPSSINKYIKNEKSNKQIYQRKHSLNSQINIASQKYRQSDLGTIQETNRTNNKQKKEINSMYYYQPRQLSPFQRYLNDVNSLYNNEDISPKIRYEKRKSQCFIYESPQSDFQLIKKLEHSSPILQELKQLDKSFEEEQKENQELINKMNEYYNKNIDEQEQINKVSSQVRCQQKTPLQNQQRQRKFYNFTNLNKSLNKKPQKDALKMDISKKDRKDLEDILISLKQYSKIIKKQQQKPQNSPPIQ